MVDNIASKGLRALTGSILAAAALVGTAHAGDKPAAAEQRTDCTQLTADERSDCERRMSESRSADQQSATAAATNERDESESKRTRVSEADTMRNEEESGPFDRESEPGEVQGADMHSAPLPNYEDANEDLTDPYQTAPEGLEPGEEATER